MIKNWKLKLAIEGLGWLITGAVVLLFIFPIVSKVHEYPFLEINIYFIVLVVTLTRYIFLLKHTFIGYMQWVKVLLVFACVPLFIFTLRQFKSFQEFLAEEGVESIMIHLPYQQQVNLAKYVSTEMIFFGSAALISVILFGTRMFISIWRLHNRGTV